MPQIQDIQFIDSSAIQTRADAYMSITVSVPAVVKSWKGSLFSFEWLHPDGSIKEASELSSTEEAKRSSVEGKIRAGKPLEKPILGIGMMDNIEIGVGRAELLTLAAQGVKTMPVHILRSNETDFKEFLAQVNS